MHARASRIASAAERRAQWKLSNASVQRLRCPSGASTKDGTVVWDTDLVGFGVRLFPSGKKNWIVQYRIGTKQRSSGSDRRRRSASPRRGGSPRPH